MPPPLPERYRLNVRLGRDGDVDEWLATDENLERPVLVRVLGPEATPQRSAAFTASVRAAASVGHPHLQKVYAAGDAGSVAYSVSEWDGAVSAADRLKAGETLPVEEFLPNAAGLADALSRFHATGTVHGAIDASAIHFSAAHPAKLGGFGRIHRRREAADDTADLADALREALTGSPNPAVKPSHVAEGLPTSVDDALDDAHDGRLDAAGLSAALQAIPYSPREAPTSAWDWRPFVVFAFVAAAAVLVAAVGLAVSLDPESAFLFPATPAETGSDVAPAPTPILEADDGPALGASVQTYDPLGDGVEANDQAGAAVDDDSGTTWQTEAYTEPLEGIKDGVGLVFSVAGAPSAMEVTATSGTTYRVGWSGTVPQAVSEWTDVASGTMLAGVSHIQLPDRTGGRWLLWLTSLPETSEGTYRATVSGVRFLP
jgi:hypothetical protein